MLRIVNVSLPLDYDRASLQRLAARRLRMRPSDIVSVSVSRVSIDARDKQDVHYVVSLDIELRDAGLVRHALKERGVTDAPAWSPPEVPQVRFAQRPLIVGAGPAGLFASLILARAGAHPILLERGEAVEQRVLTVGRMTEDGILCPESNVQFGEGGAGTFSDGKLTTGIKSPWQRFVLETFVRHGAPESILIDQKPHIGTDVLRHVIRSLRGELQSLGCDVRFGWRLDGLVLSDGAVRGAEMTAPDGKCVLRADNVLLCIGHSSRDTLQALYGLRIPMEPKPFAMGLRIEHLQRAVSLAQYGETFFSRLPPAAYKLHVPTQDGRGVYTFCMCPGGSVMAASSEPGRLCVNGMSNMARDGVNANSALLVGISPSDFPSSHPLAGMHMQRDLEEKAFRLGGGNYRAPAQRVEDFLLGRASHGFGDVTPSYRPGVAPSDLSTILPAFMTEDLRFGIRKMDAQLHGFAHPDAVLTGVEARSSSPVRMVRSASGQSLGAQGLYPCGEGAGYAGGIVSAAVDGINQAMQLLRNEAEHDPSRTL